jgi:hypothetical protein
MGFRFQKRISLFPGIRLNLSKSGASVTLGKPGLSMNLGKGGATGTAPKRKKVNGGYSEEVDAWNSF